jgi:hypothetical protein
MPMRLAVRTGFVAVLLTFCLVAAPSSSWAQTSPVSTISAEDLRQWERDLQGDLTAEKFDSLDDIAGRLRRDKTRLTGGTWQLRVFYAALDVPGKTEQDSAEHIAHLEHWMAQRPNSITARVALAAALERWAWVGRGHGYADTVTPEGGRLYDERMKEAQTILDGSQKMPAMCPQWFSNMMDVVLAQGGDRERMRKVLEDGIRFEPGYYYLYIQYANYLLPRWYGQDGEASKFASASADAVGGNAGDILYFQIASMLISRPNDDFPFHEMDWQRLQRGYQALISQYGAIGSVENRLAFMAWKFQDAAVAHQQFALIGDNWSPGVWEERSYFDRARDWAQAPTPALLPGQGQSAPPVAH